MRTRTVIVAALALAATACAPQIRRFPLVEPVWQDADRNDVPEEPSEYYSGLIGDAADQTFFYPLARVWKFPLADDAANVNALDEVPDSAWFENRIGQHDLTPEEAAHGACGDAPPLDPSKGPWLVTGAKPNGANPGFFVKAPDGQRYLLKFDGPKQPTRATGADVIGSKIYWLAGYYTPCNMVVYFPQEIIQVAEGAKAENEYGEKVPMEPHHIDKVLEKAYRLKNGLLRASASRFVPGRPIGPFTYQDTRADDPNDVIPHQDRRELRASQVLAAWINHFDSREQNTLDVWTKAEGRQFLLHYIIDWGDSLGGRWDVDGISRRLGRSYYMDFEHVLVDLLTLGIYPRVWNKLELNDYELFGYLDGDTFTASAWRGGYPNPAHDRMRPNDALWMVRILSRMTPTHIRAMVEEAKFPDSRHTEFIIQRLLERRQRILEEYLTQLAPLAEFTLARRTPGDPRQSLCWEDLALKHGVASKTITHYKLRMRGGEELDQELGWMQFWPDKDHPHRSCVALPIGHKRPSALAPADAPDDHPLRYGVLDIFIHQTKSVRPSSSVQIHFYDLGPERGFRLVGIRRPPEPKLPNIY
ncbi:MAG: hypothetical protein KC933_09990 [Myxococcales bacterium]|nr:hypothetical protein [Myxococcales bacterium]